MAFRIVDLTLDGPDLIEQAAVLLRDAFRNTTQDWQDLDSTREEVFASLAPDRISRVALDASGKVVRMAWRYSDLERLVAARGALTLWLGSDDENDETSVWNAISMRTFRLPGTLHP